jgi:hypothetical protein
MLRSVASTIWAFLLVELTVVTLNFLTQCLTHTISLELRVKERLLIYPEEVFFNSPGILAKLLSSYLIMLVLV